jgi:hypothetical protein
MGPPASPCTHAGAGSRPAFSTTTTARQAAATKSNNVVEIHAHNREGKRRPRFKPISEIIRTAKGKPIGRILRLPPRTDAYTYSGWLGSFDSERRARLAVRAEWMARR